MNPEERQMLKEALDLSRENNRLIRKMWNGVKWGRAVKAIYWIVIIGIAVGSFYFLQPYLDTLQGVYGGIQGAQNQFKSFF